ncbi:MAG TPA: M48 family metallopeptidase [Vicinamibacterales bacterium]|nr:M48 family metallopeptidase [Vicinamibacterales bacterium]
MQLAFDFTADSARPVSGGGGTVFTRHRRARRYILRVLDDGTIRVTLPRWGSKRDAQAFVARSSSWIERQLREGRARPAAAPANPALRARAGEQLPAQLLALAAVHGIEVSRVSVRNQRSRWGACSSTGTITLNWRLILAPEFVREYVMIHELMHRREMNHSKRFWRHVAAACPRDAEARAWLRRDGQRLFTAQENGS